MNTSPAPLPGEAVLARRLTGLLVGTAVGDSLGLPCEGLSPGRARRLRGSGPWRHRFLFGRGMVSDDTEHALFVAQALLAEPEDADRFARRLAAKLRWWLLALPAGVGLATARAVLKLWLGVPPGRSGVWSAGNGPAMRSALLGAYFANDPTRLLTFVTASTRLTHTDPRALTGALAVAHAAAWVTRGGQTASAEEVTRLFTLWETLASAGDTEWRPLVQAIETGWREGWSLPRFAASQLGSVKGVSGYVYQTVPVALFAWLRHRGDFAQTLEAALDCGGDTDTVGAIVGALAGADAGVENIPEPWRTGVWEWPRSLRLLEAVAVRLAQAPVPGHPPRPVPYFWPGVMLRNLLFLVVVLTHGFRRLLPPY